MSAIIGVGVIIILILGLVLIYAFRNQRLTGEEPSALSALVAILFTSGLDGGFILLPLIEYQQYTQDQSYHFTNPLSIEMGFWGITAWALYFVSSLYFLTLEPKLKLFQITWVKRLSACVVIATCAFTLSLFIDLMPFYLPESVKNGTWELTILISLVIVCSLMISIRTKLMTMLSKVSVIAFSLLCLYLAWLSNFGFVELVASSVLTTDYLLNAHRFILPFNDYHEFYLAWWMTWSIMLGQFVAKFVRNIKPLALFFIMTILPLVPSFLWFSVLYHIYESGYDLNSGTQLAMLVLGCAFVVNSIDFMVANYSQTFSLTIEKQGKFKFVVINTGLILGLTYLFQSEWMFVQTAACLVVLILILLMVKVFVLEGGMYQMKKARG